MKKLNLMITKIHYIPFGCQGVRMLALIYLKIIKLERVLDELTDLIYMKTEMISIIFLFEDLFIKILIKIYYFVDFGSICLTIRYFVCIM